MENQEECKRCEAQKAEDCKCYNDDGSLTVYAKEKELFNRFGNKFYNELGERVMNGQKMQGNRMGKMDDNALALAKQATDVLYKEWIEDANGSTDIN